MEEEMERMNPIDGRGATPSMGLSQFRGGKKATAKSLGKRIAKMEADSPSMAQTEMDAMAVMPSGEYDGGMMGCGSEAMVQGRHLGEHLHKLHGGAYMKDFHSGMGMCMKGGAQTGAYEGEGNLHITHEGGASHMEGGFLGALASMAIPLIGSLFGRGAMSKKAHDEMMAMVKKHEGKGMKGGMRMVGSGELEIKHTMGAGVMDDRCSPRAKRVVGAGDGRRKRAEIVRRVMAEKGMKMIEASKYVKEHGLY
jgi:hypothetical protein